MIDSATYASAYTSLFPFTVALLRTWDRALSREQAEDLAQDVWLRIWAGRATYRAECSLRTWMCVIARRTLSKSSARFRNYPDALHEPREDEHERERDRAYEPGLDVPIHVSQILARCDARDREILIDVYAHGSTHEEYAGAVGSAVGTVRRRTWEARKAAREAAA